MLIFGIALVSGLCLALGWLFELVILVYIALGVSLLGLAYIALHMWRAHKQQSTATGKPTESVMPTSDEELSGDSREDLSEKCDQGEQYKTPRSEDADTTRVATINGSGGVVDRSSGEHLGQGATVFVVAGRKRFHAENCRLIAEQDSDPLTLVEASEESFTPCTVCLAAHGGDHLVQAS